mmetsp:Transcript_34949/g.88838  ORF Transcript_34949/g.88838 Transcript_34949/m.88838 type:complete len:212 (+) Transcript_34949:672-1307(+)
MLSVPCLSARGGALATAAEVMHGGCSCTRICWPWACSMCRPCLSSRGTALSWVGWYLATDLPDKPSLGKSTTATSSSAKSCFTAEHFESPAAWANFCPSLRSEYRLMRCHTIFTMARQTAPMQKLGRAIQIGDRGELPSSCPANEVTSESAAGVAVEEVVAVLDEVDVCSTAMCNSVILSRAFSNVAPFLGLHPHCVYAKLASLSASTLHP